MHNTLIKILHKEKDAKTNKVCHIPVYFGECITHERMSSREQMGGVENNSDISVVICTTNNIHVECGDRCEMDGRKLTVRRVSKMISGVSDGFSHIRLSLR